MVRLSKRLYLIAKMVTKGNRVADVGCDHGYLSIYLVQSKISPAALAMDVRKGPLSHARENIEKCGLSGYIGTRLSDGLKEYHPGEADTLVCAGMGGPLMIQILSENPEKSRDFKELILQPQSEIWKVRAFIRDLGFAIVEEEICLEDGKYYFPMRAVKSDCIDSDFVEPDFVKQDFVKQDFVKQDFVKQDFVKPDFVEPDFVNSQSKGDTDADLKIYDLYGKHLILRKDPLLKQYLSERKLLLIQILDSLGNAENERTRERIEQVQEELECIDRVYELMG